MSSAIEIERYLSEDQMREIAIQEWRAMCRVACNGSAERILDNLGYAVAHRMISEALGDSADETIRDKAVKVIGDLSAFSVFREPDAWHRGASPAYTTLMNAVLENSDLVNKKVRECIAQLSKREALEVLKSGKIQINPHAKAVAP